VKDEDMKGMIPHLISTALLGKYIFTYLKILPRTLDVRLMSLSHSSDEFHAMKYLTPYNFGLVIFLQYSVSIIKIGLE
jgi:hypothetical protein